MVQCGEACYGTGYTAYTERGAQAARAQTAQATGAQEAPGGPDMAYAMAYAALPTT